MDQCVQTGNRRAKKVIYKCKPCNGCRSRLERLFKRGGQIAEDWLNLTDSEKADFVKKHAELYGDDLASAVTEFVKVHSSTTQASNLGDFHPLSIYAARGYSAELLKNIERNCPKEYNNDLKCWTYQLMVKGGGQIDKDTKINKRTHMPKVGKTARKERLKRQASNASTQSQRAAESTAASPKRRRILRKTSSCASAASVASHASTGSGKKDDSDKREKREKEGKHNDLKDKASPKRKGKGNPKASPKKKPMKGPNYKQHAKAVVSAVAPTLSSLQHIVDTKLANAKIATSVPAWLATETIEAHKVAISVSQVWSDVLSTGTYVEGSSMTKEEVMEWKKKASKTIDSINVIIAMTESRP